MVVLLVVQLVNDTKSVIQKQDEDTFRDLTKNYII